MAAQVILNNCMLNDIQGDQNNTNNVVSYPPQVANRTQVTMQDTRALVNSDLPYEPTPARVVVNNIAGNQNNYTNPSFDKRTILSAFGVMGGIAGIVALVRYAIRH